MKQELRHTSPFLKAVLGRGLLTSSRAPTIQSRRGHQCGVSKESALRLRLTGSVVQLMSWYDLLTYKAIGSNYLSFVVTSMLVFHIATGWSRNCDIFVFLFLRYKTKSSYVSWTACYWYYGAIFMLQFLLELQETVFSLCKTSISAWFVTVTHSLSEIKKLSW